ncbi:unnamed protein product, partial [Polarella glacialis]
IFINTRLWMVAVSPFSRQTLGILAFSTACLFAVLFILSESPLGYTMQPLVEGAGTTIFTSSNHLKVLFLTPLLLLVDLAIYQTICFFNPYPLTVVMRKRFWKKDGGNGKIVATE